MLPRRLNAIAEAIGAAGGRALVVGGWVRDHLLGLDSKDVDVEVYGLTLEELERLLARFGDVVTIGRSFGVLRVKGLDVDFALPRRDSKTGPGHRGFRIESDPGLTFAEAARRRDLTINSIAFDPLTGETIDPHGGARDLEAGRLRATDSRHFGEDPLRALRVAQFAARFEMTAEPELEALCAAQNITELPGERLLEEMRKLLLKGRRPSLGFELLRRTGLLRFFPELAVMVGVPQEPDWHPEGDVWVHTMMVIDVAARLRDGGRDDEALMFGALCHDVGKPSTTVQEGDRIRSPAHDVAGVPLTATLLGRLRAPGDLVARTQALVEHHLAPALFIKNGAAGRGYRRLARSLESRGVTLELLVRVARADHLGRTTADAVAGRFPAGDAFLERARALLVERAAPRDVVLGRHLIARGFVPGPAFGPILERCREVQDETGWDDADRILDAALARQTG